jgi:Arc/MetJ family transcription regulator
MQQQTTLIINDNLFAQAAQLTSIQDKKSHVELALTKIITHEKKMSET